MKKSIFAIVAIPLGSLLASTAQADDWPTFRGPDRTGVSAETDLLDEWASSGPKLVWEAKGAGRGYASPAIADGNIFTLGDGLSTAPAGDKDEYLSCFDQKSGQQLWKTKTGPEWDKGKASWQGSRGTPTIDGDSVYVITPYGKLYCCKVSDGSVVWQKDFESDFSGKKKDSWGYSESPLVDGDLLLCTPGGPVSTVVALNKKTGETVWTCVRPDDVGAGHSSIVISNVGGRKVYVQNTGMGPMGIDAETGAMLWDYDTKPPTAFIPTPIIKDEYVFTVAGYGLGGALLKQVVGGSGAVGVEEVYPLKPELGNKHGGVVRIGNYIYGGTEDRNIVFCADMMTGEVLWKERGAGERSTSVTAADGKLFLRFQNGTVALAEASPEGYKEISSFTAPGSGDGDQPSWAHPVISDGRLYLRENDSILCYQIQ